LNVRYLQANLQRCCPGYRRDFEYWIWHHRDVRALIGLGSPRRHSHVATPEGHVVEYDDHGANLDRHTNSRAWPGPGTGLRYAARPSL